MPTEISFPQLSLAEIPFASDEKNYRNLEPIKMQVCDEQLQQIYPLYNPGI